MSTRGTSRIWILRLVLPGRYGRLVSGLVIFALLYACFWAAGVFRADAAAAGSGTPALFFCVILGYIIPVFHYITEHTARELESLTAGHSGQSAQRISRKSNRWAASMLALGAASGLAHNLLLAGSPGALVNMALSREAVVVAGTMAVWLVMTTALGGLIDNALILNRLAKRTAVDLLNTANLTPFARVAVFSTLAVVGAQAAYPILIFDAEPVTYVPGIIATLLFMVPVFALPIWPVHRALREKKRATLAAINAEIRARGPADAADSEAIARLNPLLVFRREIQQVSEWPFDVGIVSRLALYLIIPPLTWVGAALIENLVDAFL